jgi:hypothetical protein
MPRKRMIDPDIWDSQQFISLPIPGRLLFIGLFSNADDEGMLRGNPEYLRKIIFGYDLDITPEQVKQWRDLIATKQLIKVLTDGNGEYINVVTFHKYQKINHPSPSKLPPPNQLKLIECSCNTTVTLHENNNGDKPQKELDSLHEDYINTTVALQDNSLLGQVSLSKVSVDKVNNPKGDDKSSIDLSYESFRRIIINPETKNKTAVLVDAFKAWHTNALPEDFNDLYKDMSGILKLNTNDYGLTLKLLWDSTTAHPQGSHIRYLFGISNKKTVNAFKKDILQAPKRNIMTPEQSREVDRKLAEERDANKKKVNNDTTK